MEVSIFFYPDNSQMRVSRGTFSRRFERGCGCMKELLMQIDEMEQELNKVQEQTEYWLAEEQCRPSICQNGKAP